MVHSEVVIMQQTKEEVSTTCIIVQEIEDVATVEDNEVEKDEVAKVDHVYFKTKTKVAD